MAGETAYLNVSPEDYHRFRRLHVDSEAMPPTFAGYLQWIYDFCAGVKSMGATPVEIVCTPEEFAAWCREGGMLPNNLSAGLFAHEKLVEVPSTV